MPDRIKRASKFLKKKLHIGSEVESSSADNLDAIVEAEDTQPEGGGQYVQFSGMTEPIGALEASVSRDGSSQASSENSSSRSEGEPEPLELERLQTSQDLEEEEITKKTTARLKRDGSGLVLREVAELQAGVSEEDNPALKIEVLNKDILTIDKSPTKVIAVVNPVNEHYAGRSKRRHKGGLNGLIQKEAGKAWRKGEYKQAFEKHAPDRPQLHIVPNAPEHTVKLGAGDLRDSVGIKYIILAAFPRAKDFNSKDGLQELAYQVYLKRCYEGILKDVMRRGDSESSDGVAPITHLRLPVGGGGVFNKKGLITAEVMAECHKLALTKAKQSIEEQEPGVQFTFPKIEFFIPGKEYFEAFKAQFNPEYQEVSSKSEDLTTQSAELVSSSSSRVLEPSAERVPAPPAEKAVSFSRSHSAEPIAPRVLSKKVPPKLPPRKEAAPSMKKGGAFKVPPPKAPLKQPKRPGGSPPINEGKVSALVEQFEALPPHEKNAVLSELENHTYGRSNNTVGENMAKLYLVNLPQDQWQAFIGEAQELKNIKQQREENGGAWAERVSPTSASKNPAV